MTTRPFLTVLLAVSGLACGTSDRSGSMPPTPTPMPMSDGGMPATGVDNDMDGFGESDCDDANPDIRPGAVERCNGYDEDCDGTIDEHAADLAVFFPDLDEDGFGDDAADEWMCEAPAGYIDRGGDCDDGTDSAFPGAIELCNGKDDDCDGVIPDIEADADGDLSRLCDGDPDDDNPVINPGNVFEAAIGGTERSFEQTSYVRGNVYEALYPAVLGSFEQRIDRTGSCTIDFYVLSAGREDLSDRRLERAVEVHAPAGMGYVGSGDLDVEIEAGRYYQLLTAWNCTTTSYIEYDAELIGTSCGFGILSGWQGTNSYAGFDPAYGGLGPMNTSGAYDQILHGWAEVPELTRAR